MSTIEPAPGGLRLVQELLNTARYGRPPGRPDLFDDLELARPWAHGTLDRIGASRTPVTPADVAALRELRDAIRLSLHRRSGIVDDEPFGVSEQLTVQLGPDGQARYVAGGRASAVIRGAVLTEVLLAQATGEWLRFKLCQLIQCDVAFYDTSRNRSARWHDERCGNYVNLMASRQRRKAEG